MIADTAPRPPGHAASDADLAARDDRLVRDAIDLAQRLLRESDSEMTARERRRHDRLGTLLDDHNARELIFALTDEVLRVDDQRLAARRFADVVGRYPTKALGVIDGAMLRAGALVAPRLPRIVMPLVTRRIKAETHGIVLPANDPGFAKHVQQRTTDGVALNINPLGEAILSDAEAEERMRAVLARIARPDVDYVSVKISAIVANLDVLAFDETVERVCAQLRVLFAKAEVASPTTFINLDMEEYQDLELTLHAFMRVLDEPKFEAIDAGIVLQAYLPDSHDALERLGAWALRRNERGGGAVKVRLVKGANLAMEEVEAELHGWRAAPYGTKAAVDASYKAMLDSALRPEWAASLRVGLASHNLFDVAWALVLGRELGALDRIEFEMLEGMAPAQARATHAQTGGLLMYAPVVSDVDFDASIAYLSRRLDENTQPDNFLRSLFTLTADSPQFAEEAARFSAAVAQRTSVSTDRRRWALDLPTDRFVNEPDSDMTDPDLRVAIEVAIAAPPSLAQSADMVRVDSTGGIDRVVDIAVQAAVQSSRAQRRTWLAQVAAVLRAERVETMGLLANEVGKTAHEGDPEVSEAIDFCRYYGTVGIDGLDRAEASGLDVKPRGVVAVVCPWNFPYAIPIGGVAASLAAGNSVILKPAPEATAIGAWIADQFWRAGVPRDVLQLVVCDDNEVGTHLVTHPDLDTIILTGSYDTAALFLGWRPDRRVLAETSGKNALVITASADIDLAIADLVTSAFGHAGQKCSAASLGIIEASVYDDPAFMQRLADAVRSVRALPATNTASMMGPLIAAPSGSLERALTTLEPGERWLVEPRRLDADGEQWSPGVRADVQPNSWFHRTECFGPVLGLMRAEDLDHALELQNATDFGLTGGIHSLDTGEIDHWLDVVQVGNAYVNRQITGAIVQRQPFGGWKRSAVGGGAKAGGPGYVAQFAQVSGGDASDADALFAAAWRDHFSVEHDDTGLRSEANVLRYVPLGRVVVRHAGTTDTELGILRAAARVSGVVLMMSDASEVSDTEFAKLLCDSNAPVDRIRLLGGLSDDARRVAHERNIPIDTSIPVADGMIELQRWVREQAISRTYHRHGRLTR